LGFLTGNLMKKLLSTRNPGNCAVKGIRKTLCLTTLTMKLEIFLLIDFGSIFIKNVNTGNNYETAEGNGQTKTLIKHSSK